MNIHTFILPICINMYLSDSGCNKGIWACSIWLRILDVVLIMDAVIFMLCNMSVNPLLRSTQSKCRDNEPFVSMSVCTCTMYISKVNVSVIT